MISTHVPSLELCKKLRDLGWKKETMFYYCMVIGAPETENKGWKLVYYDGKNKYLKNVGIPAPTVGEMLSSFPKDTLFKAVITPDKMLCDLLENNLVKLEES